MIQIVLTLLVFAALVIPMGKYLFHIAAGQRTFCDPVFDRVDNAIYRVCRVRSGDMNWKQYALALLVTNACMVALGYLILRVQALSILNPNGIAGMEPTLSYNTVISFITNTNLQHYSGESELSYLSQMLVITFMMFTSAASGYAACMAFIRGLTGNPMGNFYRDVVRVITRVLLPICFVMSLLLVLQGVPQTLAPNLTLNTIEGKLQSIPMGPIASLESIKHLGNNGGGFVGANSATPLENPSVFSNIMELIAMMILPGACVVAFGHMASERKAQQRRERPVLLGREGAPVFAVMSALLVIGIVLCYISERMGNPLLANLGLNQAMGSMEGKEVRFGIAQSALFTTVTTAFTTGTVNNMHDTLTPLGGLVPMANMMLNVVFGGKGVGLMNMLLYAILSVFLCGLMIGRTPEYLGKKIESAEMKLTAIGIIIHPLLILAFSALAVTVAAGLAAISNPGHHGLSQVLYEYASSAANNGSGFEGLGDNTAFWNITTGLAMFFGRYLAIVIQLAIAGSLLAKKPVSESLGTLKTDTRTFTIALMMVVLVVAALTFFPALSLGPIAEHLALWQ